MQTVAKNKHGRVKQYQTLQYTLYTEHVVESRSLT